MIIGYYNVSIIMHVIHIVIHFSIYAGILYNVKHCMFGCLMPIYSVEMMLYNIFCTPARVCSHRCAKMYNNVYGS